MKKIVLGLISVIIIVAMGITVYNYFIKSHVIFNNVYDTGDITKQYVNCKVYKMKYDKKYKAYELYFLYKTSDNVFIFQDSTDYYKVKKIYDSGKRSFNIDVNGADILEIEYN